VVVIWGEMVVMHHSVEMFEQCLGASSCMRTHIVLEEYYIGCQHSIPFVLNSPAYFWGL
jgi:hypothetical protein